MACWTHIAHDSLTLPASSVTWSSIPSSYDHLLVKASARQDGAYHYVNAYITLNNDTGSNYSHTTIRADSATIETNQNASRANIHYCMTPAASATASTFGAMTIWIPHYTNTSYYKQMIASSAAENASTASGEWWLNQTAGLWQSQAAVTQITIDAYATDDFVANSTFDLYGITNNA